ncbi:MAG: terminase family protein [Epibacterium sp.]|nr:terminase family protein [Epibacterium sp.]
MWFLGHNPDKSFIIGTYNQTFARDFGRQAISMIRSEMWSRIFPDVQLEKGSEAQDAFRTTAGGAMYFVGRESSVTGRAGDFVFLDDLFKDMLEAESERVRTDVWNFYNSVADTRMHDKSRAVMTMTRWHDDDLIGRMTNPMSDFYVERSAKQWKVINIPAIAGDNDILGREPGEALWPSKFSINRLETQRERSSDTFSCLYQGNPTPEEGVHFERHMIRPYNNANQIPSKLSIYAAVDFALGVKRKNDSTVMITAGLDDERNLWILPNIFWKKRKSDLLIDEILNHFEMHDIKPNSIFHAKGLIDRALMPLIKSRQEDRGIYAVWKGIHEAQDILQRASSIRGLMDAGKVFFPSFAWWYGNAKTELLHCPRGQHDDFVAALALMGLGLDKQMSGGRDKSEIPREERYGTSGSIHWIKQASQAEKRRKRINLSGM